MWCVCGVCECVWCVSVEKNCLLVHGKFLLKTDSDGERDQGRVQKVILYLTAHLTLLQSAAVGGAAHLINFNGTATIAGAVLARSVRGFSIPRIKYTELKA